MQISLSRPSIRVSIAILVLVHFSGFVGMHVSSVRGWFESLTWANLLLCLGLLLWHHSGYNGAFITFLCLVFVGGFVIEWIGIQTGIIFGEYAYDTALGIKWGGTPVSIGINWVLLVYACGSVVYQYTRLPRLAQAVLGAALMVYMDYWIEPVAVRHAMWHWAHTEIPLQNYVAWGVFGFVFQLGFFYLPFSRSNRLAAPLLFIQFLFFVGHYIYPAP